MKGSPFSSIAFTAPFLLSVILFFPSLVNAEKFPPYFGQASETLLPQNIPPAFFTFSPDEYYLEPNDSYWVGADRDLGRGWLFGEIIPAVEFPRNSSFKDRASLILRIELFFSGNIDRF